ncbi:MAG: ROK family protein [Candidatus Marinimicrobia bacterium]|nr:ROK family protein [Candidatus Neomarinimicrobiota bacterium]
MSRAAISEIITRLLNMGFIKEEGKGESTSRGGKRPTNLYIDPSGGYVFGLQIKRSSALIMMANIMGEEIGRVQLEYEPHPPLKSTFILFAETMDNMIGKAELLKDKLLGIGIGVPGMVDMRTGELILAETLEGWANQPFAELFSAHFEAPVLVENDINIQTWGEYLLGAGVHQDDMVLMHIGDGIGAGIIENEVLVRGIMRRLGRDRIYQSGTLIRQCWRIMCSIIRDINMWDNFLARQYPQRF